MACVTSQWLTKTTSLLFKVSNLIASASKWSYPTSTSNLSVFQFDRRIHWRLRTLRLLPQGNTVVRFLSCTNRKVILDHDRLSQSRQHLYWHSNSSTIFRLHLRWWSASILSSSSIKIRLGRCWLRLWMLQLLTFWDQWLIEVLPSHWLPPGSWFSKTLRLTVTQARSRKRPSRLFKIWQALLHL